MFEYYATGKTIPKHAKLGVMGLIALMTFSSATFVWYVSTLGDGQFTEPGLGMVPIPDMVLLPFSWSG